MKAKLLLVTACLPLLCGIGHAASTNPATDWFKDARYGVFMHFLPGDAKSLALVKDFDVEALAGQLEAMGAKYLVAHALPALPGAQRRRPRAESLRFA